MRCFWLSRRTNRCTRAAGACLSSTLIELIGSQPRGRVNSTVGRITLTNVKKKVRLLPLMLVACAGPVHAQGFLKFDCVIARLKLDSTDPRVVDKQPVKQFAAFKVNGVGEEERVTRFFRLPKTGWFVVASLYSTDESMASKNGPDSIDLELSLAKRRKRNIFISPSYASSETPFNPFDIARVSMMVHLDGHREMVVMECKGSH